MSQTENEEEQNMESQNKSDVGGAIAWMTRNSVAANLLMFILLLAGFFSVMQTKQEVFPEFSIDIISVTVPYPGASPEEVEQGIILAVEEELRGIDGIKRLNSNASENVGGVIVELLTDAKPDKVLNDVKAAVDRITTFPEESEKPQVSELSLRREVITLILSGDQDLRTLHQLAEEARAEIRQDPNVTQVEIVDVPDLEMSVEIPQSTLEAHGLTLDGVAQQIRIASLELPSGGIKTDKGEILIRVADRKKSLDDFSNIIIQSSFQGAELRLGDIATITDGYTDTDEESYYNGKRAVRLVIYRIGDQTPTDVANAVKEYRTKLQSELPESVSVSIWNDSSEILKGRIQLLVDNARIGLILVFIILALFLEFRLAFWVAMGIPISFLGSFILLGQTGATINMISLFAYIVTLGLVVDDAIVVGENIFEKREQGLPWLEAAVEGSKEMAVPVTFAVLTSVAAFSPLLLVPGVSGKFFGLIPTVVISVLLLSLVESFFVLPAHLGHMSTKEPGVFLKTVNAPREWVAKRLQRFIDGPFHTVLDLAVRFRYVSFSIAIAMFLTSIGVVGGGLLPFSFFPKIESDRVSISAKLPYGAPIEQTALVQRTIEEAIEKALDESEEKNIVKGIFSTVGAGPIGRTGVPKGSHLTAVTIEMVSSEYRDIGAEEFSGLVKKHMPPLPGVDNLKYNTNLDGPGAGAAVDIQMTSEDFEELAAASDEMASILRSYPSLISIENTYSAGKQQLDFQLLPEGRTIGLTSSDVARQLRSSFFGAEALREQVGRLERRTMVRLPKDERLVENDIDNVRIRIPMGGYVPLEQVAQRSRGQAPTSITREDGIRSINVRADLAPGVPSSRDVLTDLQESVFPELQAKYPGVKLGFAGEQRDQRETMASLGQNYLLALLVIYGLLAIPFKSYIQPFIIMSAIPFGFVGAVGGHMLMGFSLSVISMFGIVALTGVVVNDSLVLIDAANTYRRNGESPLEAVMNGAKRRFRPILLTSLTTFLGLAPMILEKSMQARFLIPMAISLGFGVLFATGIILLVVPSLYMIVEDILGLTGRKSSEESENDSSLLEKESEVEFSASK